MADELSIHPGASEAEVAETIVSARKSWKTVKGKSEPVWPPVLEKALVKALLQYKPTDSRYARALGRFPKRNRFISDYIFEHTGQRRTPKQVGSRLQQLKDVNCGKQLLSHVASWSLGPTPPAPSGMEGIDYSSQHHHISIHPMSGLPSDCTPSPSSPFPHIRTPFGSDQSGLSPLNTSFYSPTSAYSSLPVTPQVRRLEVFLPYDPAAPPAVMRSGNLMRFSGCLARPESVQAESEQPSSSSHSSHSRSPPPSRASSRSQAHSNSHSQPAVLEREPKVSFTAREPIAASSVVNVWVEGGPADDGSGASVRTAHREVSPLLCIGTPSLAPSYGGGSDDDEDGNDFEGTQNNSSMKNTRMGGRQMQQASRQVEYFSYSTQLVSPAFWESLRRDANLSKYTITQDLVYQLDTPTARPGDSFLTITYRFVPTSTPTSPLTHASQIRAMRAQGSASPASSSGSSHSSSASPASIFQMPLQQNVAHHQQQQQQHQYLQQQQQMVSQGMYQTATSMGLSGHVGLHSQMLPPMMALAPSGCSSASSSSSSNGGYHSRHGSPHDHLYASALPSQQQLHPSPGGSPLSAGFPPLSARSGMTPVLGYEDDFGIAVGAGGLGVPVVNDFTFSGAASAHGSPLALA
ncbi:hypothetical protein SCHPADRAFT_890703 [Schizopora paradoxa]|uniref:TEA domain-containing protein n=1 Tax=Schizopora paradoxa TaxID=27342 RepID=A0A0H2RSY4_9AGAM|nr:hypothetical protein SCHPADRAFT_890703 [Schizopora paradoxa]